MFRRGNKLDRALRDLHDANWKKRRRAMQQLEEIGGEAIPGLVTRLSHEVLTIRLTASETLEMIGEESVAPLIATLLDGSPIARRHAAASLGQIKTVKAVGPLGSALVKGSIELRRAAALALGSIGGAGAVPSLVSALVDDDPTVRGHSVEALGRIGDPGAIEGLAGRLRDAANYLSSESRVCDAAAGALKKIGTAEAHRHLERIG